MSGTFFYTGIVVPVLTLIPICAGGYKFRSLDRSTRIIFYYLIVAGLINAAGNYMAKHRINNLWLLHCYTAIETVILLLFYREIIGNIRIKRIIPYLMVLFPLVCLANIIWWQSLMRFNSYTRPVEALLLIYMGLVYFFERSQAPPGPGKDPDPALPWVNTGLLLYFSASFFIFIFANYLHPEQFINKFILNCHATFVLGMYLLFTVGFLKCNK